MWITFSTILIPIVFLIELTEATENTWLTNLAEQIQQSLKPYQLTVFYSSPKEGSCEYEEAFRKILYHFPAMTVNLQKLKLNDMHQYSRLSIFSNPSYTTVYTILECDDFKAANESVVNLRLNEYVDVLVKISPYAVRPKYLLILLSDKNTTHNYSSLFRYAWENRFLDFSILNIVNEKALLHYFNPFYNTFKKLRFECTTQIFPNKLNNVNGYPLKLPAFSKSPILNIIRDQNENIVDTKGIHRHLMEIACNKLNFSVKYLYINSSDYKAILKDVIRNLFLNKVDAVPIPLLRLPYKETDLFSPKTILELDQGFLFGTWDTVVPILQMDKINLSSDVFLYIFAIPSTCLILIYIMKTVCTIIKTDLETLDIFGLLLGVSVVPNWIKVGDKLLFVFIFIIYIYYSTDFISNFTGLNVISKEVPFDTIQEINESPLQLYMAEGFSFFSANQSSPDVTEINNKAIKVPNVDNCLNLLEQRRNVMCICPTPIALRHLAMSQNLKKEPMMKISKAILSQARLIFITQGASPYYDRFKDLFQRIYESGMYDYLRLHYKETYLKPRFTQNTSKAVEIKQLIIVAVVGYGISLIVFILELFYKKKFVKLLETINNKY